MSPEIRQPTQQEGENSKIPSWKETAPKLSDTQLITAEIAFSSKVLERFLQSAQDDLPQLRSDAYRVGRFEGKEKPRKRRDRKLRAEKAVDLLEAFRIVISGDEEQIGKFKQKLQQNEHVVHQVETMVPELEEEKNRIFAEAQNWHVADQRKTIREAHKHFTELPKDARISLYDHTGLSPEKVRQKLKRWGITIGANVASEHALEGIAGIAGALTVSSNVLENVDTQWLLLALAGAYGVWFKGMGESIKENWNALEQEGVGTNAFAKAGYEISKSRRWSEKKQKIATGTGYAGWEIGKEAMWYVGLFGAAGVDIISNKEVFIFTVGANATAGVYEYVVAKGIKKTLELRRGHNNTSQGQIESENTI